MLVNICVTISSQGDYFISSAGRSIVATADIVWLFILGDMLPIALPGLVASYKMEFIIVEDMHIRPIMDQVTVS